METMLRPPRTGLEVFEMLPEGTLCQLINDAIIMSPAPNTPHATVQSDIYTDVNIHVRKLKLGRLFFAPVDVYLDDKNIYQPDIFFVSKDRKSIIQERGIFGAPDLVIEILSQDRHYDLITKKKVYEECGVNEYWVVDPITKWCEGFVLQDRRFVSLGSLTGTLTIQMFSLQVNF